MDYNTITDEELINIHKKDNKVESDALQKIIERYTPIINNKANKYFAIGFDKNDIIQEGMIGLLSAVKNYDNESNTSFKTFANLCIDRKLITLLKSANRQKQMPLNNAISLNKKINGDIEENDNELMEIIDNGYNPVDDFINKEYYKRITYNLYNKLSKHEKDVLNEYLTGKSYAEIAQKLNCQEKSVDTALTRIRRKGADLMQDYNMPQ